MGYTNFYATHNRCRRCQISYSKDILYCFECGSRVATKRRVYSKEHNHIRHERIGGKRI